MISVSDSVEQIFYYRALGLYETSTFKFGTYDVHEYLKITTPMEITNNIINIQPMTGPIGQIFTLRDRNA